MSDTLRVFETLEPVSGVSVVYYSLVKIPNDGCQKAKLFFCTLVEQCTITKTKKVKIQSPNKSLILLGFVLLKFILQYSLISPVYDLQRDEYLHLNMAHHLAWGYVSVPPVTSWISFIIGLLGNGVFWVKFFPALFGALTIVLVWKTVEVLNGNVFALLLSATCVLFSAVLRLNVLFQPNSLDLLCWMAFYYVVVNYFKEEQIKWLYYGALVFAIGFLNKYNIVFLVAGLLPAVYLHRSERFF
jgi:4-amino-4-deoxy-L-arabinose transferase-like glycosyltransferase